MQNAVAYEAQCRSRGGLPKATRRKLLKIASGTAAADASARNLRPGTHLVREWNGRTYLVEVMGGGYSMDGKTWPSLSAIAKHITGTTWSGPRFFGTVNGRSQSG